MENPDACRTVEVIANYSCGKLHCGSCNFNDSEHISYCVLFRVRLTNDYILGAMRCEKCLLAGGELA